MYHIIGSILLLAYAVYIDEPGLQFGALLWLLGAIGFSAFLSDSPKQAPQTPQAPQKPQPPKAEPFFKVSVKVGEPYYNTRIAGVQYRNTTADVGAFLGFVKPDILNEHDPNAVGIYNNEGKLLGYIPKDDLPNYRKWASKDILPCVGFIKEGDEVPLYGKVKIMDTEMEEVELLTAQYVRWMVNKFGLAFIPTDFNIDPAPTSKQHALDILDEYIDKKEADLFEEVDNDDE